MAKNKYNNGYLWKSDVKALFEEILGANKSMWIMQQPLRITYDIMREGAQRAQEIGDPKLIAIFTRLGMYEINTPDGLKDTKLIERIIKNGYKSKAALSKANPKNKNAEI
jgi:hypothetical protein